MKQVQLKPKFRILLFFIYAVPFGVILCLIDILLKNKTPFFMFLLQASIFGLFMTIVNKTVSENFANKLSRLLKTDVKQN